VHYKFIAFNCYKIPQDSTIWRPLPQSQDCSIQEEAATNPEEKATRRRHEALFERAKSQVESHPTYPSFGSDQAL
jgi:hypothetical protein